MPLIAQSRTTDRRGRNLFADARYVLTRLHKTRLIDIQAGYLFKLRNYRIRNPHRPLPRLISR